MQRITDMIGRRYRLEAILGEGGMGTVYRALDRLTGERVALKQVSARPEKLQFGATVQLSGTEQSTDLRLSLAQEFKLLASLRHPHIISVLDYGFEAFDNEGSPETRPYFTMELLENPRTIVDAAHGHPLKVQIDLLAQLLRALAYLHRRGIIHRDIKPSNVMVVEGDSGLTIKALDFGLSAGHGETNGGGTTAGTLAYMAPEMLTGGSASEASDLYAVGIIAYEIFSGRHPFQLHDVTVMLSQIFGMQPDLSLMPNDAVAMVIERLLAKNTQERYTDANIVIQSLGNAIHATITQETTAVRESFLQAARLVGRDAELAQLTHAFENAMHNNMGSAWLIGGESGVGKSRLLDELRTWAQVRGALVLRGSSVDAGGGLYGLWRPIVRWLSLLAELNDEEAGILKALVPDIATLLERDVADVTELPPLQAKQRLFATIEQLFRRQALPILLLLEDLHWTQESLDILTHINKIVGDLPLLIIGSYRDDERPNLPSILSDMHPMKLHRLNANGIAELSEAMLGSERASQEVVDLLQRETEGNVFFLIEVVRALAEDAGQLDRIGTTTLPSAVFSGGIQRIVERRLERVPERSRLLLQQAALLGRVLDMAVIKALAAHNIVVAPLHQRDYSPLDDWLATCADASILEVYEGRWRFAHDKLREGVLTTIDETYRPVLHQDVALALEHVYPESSAHVVALAYHWGIAGDYEKIIHYNMLAAEQALRSGVNRSAKGFVQRALDALMILDPSHVIEELMRPFIELVLKFSKASMDQPSDDVLQYLQEALAAAEALGDEGLQARVLNSTGAYHFITGQLGKALGYFNRSIPLAEKLELEELLPLSYNIVGQSLYVQGNLPRATRMIYKGIGLSERYHEVDLYSSSLAVYASALSMQGRHIEGLPYAQRAIETGEQVHLRRLEVNLMTLAFGAGFSGQHEAAIEYAERALQSNEQTQALYTLFLSTGALGNVYLERGDLQKARYHLERSVTTAEKAKLVVNLPLIQAAYRCHLEIALGQWDEALEGAADTLQLAQATMQRGGEGAVMRALGIIYSHQHKWDEADDAFQQAIAIFTECAMQPRIAITTIDHARSYLARGMKDAAHAACEQAFADFERMSMAWHLAQAQALAKNI